MTLDNLTSPTWWVTAVIGAVVLKVIADYAKKGVDRVLALSFAAWNARSQAAKKRTALLVLALQNDFEFRQHYWHRETRNRLLSITLLLLSIFEVICIFFFRTVMDVNKLSGGNQQAVAALKSPEMVYFFIGGGVVAAVTLLVSFSAMLTATSIQSLLMKAGAPRKKDAADSDPAIAS